MRPVTALIATLAATSFTSAASAQLTLTSQIATGHSHVGMGYSHLTDRVWVYEAFGALLRPFSSSGTAAPTLPRPSAATANDADIEVAPVDFILGTTLVPAGSLLYIDGETSVAEVYAVNPTTGAVIATLTTSFGASHVVGGAFHPTRGTLFLVQDRVPSNAALRNLIAEIDPSTGAVINSFQTTTTRPTFTVNYGDMDIGNNGNLLVVSSDEETIGEFTPQGAFVAEHALPTGVESLCGIGVDPSRCEIWVASTSSNVWRLTLPPGHPLCGVTCGNQDFNGDGDFGTDSDIEAFFACLGGNCCPTCFPGGSDFNGDGDFGTDADIESFFRVLGGGPC